MVDLTGALGQGVYQKFQTMLDIFYKKADVIWIFEKSAIDTHLLYGQIFKDRFEQ